MVKIGVPFTQKAESEETCAAIYGDVNENKIIVEASRTINDERWTTKRIYTFEEFKKLFESGFYSYLTPQFVFCVLAILKWA